MQKIQMVDLIGQYREISHLIGDGLHQVMESAAFINGPEVKSFEKNLADYLQAGEVVACGNGTDALQIALMALGLKSGDEVIVPSFTYVASAEVIALLGLVPVPVDVHADYFNMCPKSFEVAISDRTKAVIPVHLFGQTCKMDKIMEIATEHELFVVEDNAQSIGGSYQPHQGQKRKAGSIGHIGTTSFYPSKNLGCYGDGGALICSDPDLSKKIRMIANHGQSKRYYHDLIGVNSRLDSFQAVVLNAKLNKLDSYIQARQEAAAKYDEQLNELSGIQIPARAQDTDHVFHQYTIKVKDGKRDALQAYLSKHDIPSMIYYPVAIHEQKAFQASIQRIPDLQNTNIITTEVLSLPMHTELGNDQIGYITEKIKSFFQ
jgi:dTDP-4-amino-4,6-dideoxygalactose transaminase